VVRSKEEDRGSREGQWRSEKGGYVSSVGAALFSGWCRWNSHVRPMSAVLNQPSAIGRSQVPINLYTDDCAHFQRSCLGFVYTSVGGRHPMA